MAPTVVPYLFHEGDNFSAQSEIMSRHPAVPLGMDNKLDELNRWLAIFAAADGLLASATILVSPPGAGEDQRGQRLTLEAVKVAAGTATRYREDCARITLDSLGAVALASEFTGRARTALLV